MWPRAAARRVAIASRQVSRATQIHPKPPTTTTTTTPLTKTAGVATLLARRSPTTRSDADASGRPRAMTSSTHAGDPAGVSKSETYLDCNLPKPDIDFDHIESTMTCERFHDSVWGFVIYRCSSGHQSAWNRLLQDLRSRVQESLRFYIRQDLLPFHDLHVIDDPKLYGATSHQVRDHFQSWVSKNLEARLRPDATDSEDYVNWLNVTSTPRYLYCLFADDICLESMDHPGVNSPVVKLLEKNWGPLSPEERNYTVHAPFHDGTSEDDEEDVGWMYLPLQHYLWKYDWLAKSDWDTMYVRPPYIDGSETESDFVGHWREREITS